MGKHKYKKKPEKILQSKEEKIVENIRIDKPDANLTRLEKVADKLQASRIAEYVELSQRPWRIIWTGLISGISKGLGFTIGTAIVIAIIYKIVKKLISMNIPYLTEALEEFVLMIKGIH